MGISFGSVGKKPYVGSKEVQEAYVGSQLVYKAQKLPYHYVFLGTENEYYISPLVTLGAGAAITKPGWATTYKIALSSATGNEVKINIDADFVGQRFKFLCRSAVYAGSFTIKIYDSATHVRISTDYEEAQSEELRTTVPIQPNDKFISIRAQSQMYFDAMRFED